MKKHPSIFNDVLSPVTPGPSSSNTCGPYRIACLCRQLLGEPAHSLTIHMAKSGGYADTFFSMQSDLASIAGLLGKDLLAYDLTNAYADAKAEGLDLSFQFTDTLPEKPSELAELVITGSARSITVIGVSLGGGEIEITKINGHDVCIDGKSPHTVLFCKDGSILIDEATASERVLWRSSVTAVFPFPRDSHSIKKPPFSTAAEMLSYAHSSHLPLGDLALRYESAVTGCDKDMLLSYARGLYDLAIKSMDKGKESGIQFSGVTAPKVSLYQDALTKGRLISLGAADCGCLDALAVMEYSNSHGIIVCMPTGGASGVIPAAIHSVGLSLKLSEERILQAFLVAGLIGVFYYPTHYTGALGCQAEIGVAISMAAAAIASMMTDDPDTIEKAASLGGQSVMGMICNPIDGYVQVPCILRNMTAVPTAITCANAAIAGLDSVIPLDDIASLMLKVGQLLRPCNQAGIYQSLP